MEFPTIDASAKLAKRELHSDYFPRDYISKRELLARLTPPTWASLSPKELHARFAAEIDAARAPWERGKDRTNIVDEPDDDELVPVPAAPQPAPVPAPADGLKTQAQAARRLNISIRTLRGLVASGELRYVNVGRGKQREKMMFTDSDLDDLIASRTRQKAQQSCPSTSPRARRTTTSTSSAEVLVFTARRNGQTGAKPKR